MYEKYIKESSSKKKFKKLFSSNFKSNFQFFKKYIPLNQVSNKLKVNSNNNLTNELEIIQSEQNRKKNIVPKTLFKTKQILSLSKTVNSFSSETNTTTIGLNQSHINKRNNEEDKKDFHKKIKNIITEIESKHKYELNNYKNGIYDLGIKGNKLKLKIDNSFQLNMKKNKSSIFQKMTKLISYKNKNKKEKSVDNIIKLKRKKVFEPTNNIEMNKILIKNYGLTKGLTEMNIGYSKKLSKIGERYLNILENMKMKRTKVRIDNFDKLKESMYNLDKDYIPTEDEVNLLTNNKTSLWEKNYFQKYYLNEQILNDQFEKVYIRYKKNQKKKIKLYSKHVSNIIKNNDDKPYEKVDKKKKIYPSSKSQISKINLNRVTKLLNTIKNGEDYEREGLLNISTETLKDEQKKQEDKLYLTLHNLGPPNFISSKFRNKTVSKFNCVSGDYFGIPV